MVNICSARVNIDWPRPSTLPEVSPNCGDNVQARTRSRESFGFRPFSNDQGNGAAAREPNFWGSVPAVLTLLAIVILAAASWAAGAWPAIVWRPSTEIERVVVRLGNGLIIIAATHGALCLWSTRVAAGILMALAGAGAVAAVRGGNAGLSPFGPADRKTLVILIAIVAIAGLLPITASDSLSYHLPVVRRVLAEHRLRFWPDVWRSVFPQSHELLAVFIGELGGNRCGWIAGGEFVLLWGALLALGRRAVGADGWLVPVIFSGGVCPIVLLIDPLKPDLLVLLALALGLLALVSRKERQPSSTAILVGLAAGACIGAKYSAIPVAVLLVASAAIESGRPIDALVAGAAALTVGGFWYVRNLVMHGTPAPPFLAAPFLSTAGRQSVETAMRSFGSGRSVSDFMIGPVKMFLEPRRFGGTGGLSSPLIYLGFGALFIRAERRLALRAVGAFVVLYAAWFITLQNPRLLLPAMLPIAIMAAVVIQRVRSAGMEVVYRMATGAALLALVPGLFVILLSSARYIRSGEPEYLRERSPFYDDIQRIDAELPAAARVLSLTGALGAGPPRWLPLSPYIQAELPPEEMSGGDPLKVLRQHGVTNIFGTWATFQTPPWSFARDHARLIWRNPDACACGRHLLRTDAKVETALFEIDK
jgi:hypothetical protein